MSSTEQSVPPVVCTLTTRELASRTLEWGDLSSLAISSERIEHGVASTYPLDLLDAIEDLANREVDCCGTWLTTRVTADDSTVRLELTTANPDGLAVIMRMSSASS